MEYIKRTSDGILLCSEGNKIILKSGIKQYLNALCMANLATFDGRKKAVGKLLGEKKNLPIYINPEIFVYPTKALREYDMVFINYHRVLSYQKAKDDKTKIIFDNFEELTLNVKVQRIKKQHQRIANIIQYLEDNGE